MPNLQDKIVTIFVVLSTEQSSARACVDCQHHRDAFHSTKHSENLETGANGTKMTGSRKSGNCWIFTKSEPSKRKSRKFRDESQMERKLRLRNFRTPCKVVLFSRNFKKSCTICHWKFPEIKPELFIPWKVSKLHRVKINFPLSSLNKSNVKKGKTFTTTRALGM